MGLGTNNMLRLALMHIFGSDAGWNPKPRLRSTRCHHGGRQVHVQPELRSGNLHLSASSGLSNIPADLEGTSCLANICHVTSPKVYNELIEPSVTSDSVV